MGNQESVGTRKWFSQ